MLIALVANPKSGGSSNPVRIAEELRRRGAQVESVSLDDLTLPAGTDRVVVAGGDGSIGVAALAAHDAGVPLAVIPTGTANDFARALELPDQLAAACALAADPEAGTRVHELGRVGDHPFVNAAAAGLSAVASRLAEPLKPRLGPLAYTVAALRAGLTAKTLPCRVRSDGIEVFHGRVWQVVVGVTGAFGGGSQIGATRHDDDLLDVAVVPAGSRVALVRRAYGMRRGRLTAQSDVPHHRGRVIEVELPAGTPFNIDGDLQQPRPARFELVPGGVRVVVPAPVPDKET